MLAQTDLPLPPLFAVVAKLLGSLGGDSELALRLFPALCGVLLLPLAYLAVRTLRLPRSIALAGTGLCASGLMLLIASRDLKQYGCEAFFSVLMAVLAFRVRRCRSGTRRWAIGAAIVAVCLVGPWFGYGAILPLFVLSAMLVVLKPMHGSRRAGIITGGAALLTVAVSVIGVWHLAAGAQAGDPSLVQYTQSWHIQPFSAHSWLRAVSFAAISTVQLFFPQDWFVPYRPASEGIFLCGVAALIWVLALLGLRTWPRRSRLEMTCWVLGPWLAMLGAALLQRYPFAVTRMMPFWAVPMMLAVAAALATLCREVSTLAVRRGAPALVSAMFLGVLPAIYVIRVPTESRYTPVHDFPHLLEVLERGRRPGELVLADVTAVPSVRYYAPDLAPPVVYASVAAGVVPLGGQDDPTLLPNAARRAGRRWWLLTTNAPRWKRYQDLRTIVEEHGYAVEVAARGGLEDNSGWTAELLVARRR